jgi:5-oxoprolinase (ATP-hydrolysing) subunit A
MQYIDLNCDMGESTSQGGYTVEKDLQLLRYISSMNLACGYHAGDAHTMHELADAALEKNVAIGAHPGFWARENFGRTSQTLPPVKIYDIILYQLGALDAFLRVKGTRLHHVKPHGALYNMAAADRVMADAICAAIKDFDDRLILYGLSGSQLITAATAVGLKTCREVFADRTYLPSGLLTPRHEKNALIENTAQSLKQVLQMVLQKTVTAVSGDRVSLQADTICIHGDGKHAVSFAAIIHETLTQHHVLIQHP